MAYGKNRKLAVAFLAASLVVGCASFEAAKQYEGGREIIGSRSYPQPGPTYRPVSCITYRYQDGTIREECL